MRSSLTSLAWCALLGATLVASPACKKRTDGALQAPANAERFEPRFAVAFDDKFTGVPLEMGGRAPNDVYDQRLFAARIGYANVVAEVEVLQVWARGRYQGRPEQYLDVKLGEVLIGELPKKTAKTQLLQIDADSDLAMVKKGNKLLLFLKWAPGADPSYRHHLMPQDPELLALLNSMIAHADEAGQPVVGGKKARKKAKQKAKREKKRESAEKSADG